MSTHRCPNCGHEISLRAKRVCALCEKQVRSHHKWFFRDDGRIQHRHCDNPDHYYSKEEQQERDRVRAAERGLANG